MVLKKEQSKAGGFGLKLPKVANDCPNANIQQIQ